MQDETALSRRQLLAGLTAGTLGLPGVPGEAALQPPNTRRAEPIPVGDRKQLFLDDRFIARRENVTLAMNQPQKLGIVFDSSGAPWELGTGGFFRVIEDGGKCRLYYGCFARSGHALGYAESDDGLHWTRPALGIVDIDGRKDNNLIYPDDAIDATILHDPHDVPARRYKLFRSKISSDRAVAGVYASCSADGIHFTEAGRVFPMWPETGLNAYWDDRIGKYVVFTRVFVHHSENQRRVARIVADDLLKPWPYRSEIPSILVPSPDNIDIVLSVDDQDDPYSDIYTNAAFLYPHADAAYLMFPSPFRHFAPARQPWFRFEPGNDYGLIEVQMAISRDGIHWSRPDRRPYFPMGLPDEWDRWLTLMGTGMVRRGSYLYQYYWSSGRMHDSGILRPEYARSLPNRSAIGALRQRLDGFMSADFAYTGGSLTTPLLRFTGTHLRLNIDAGAMGTAFVELRDEQGRPMAGFTRQECEEIGGNFVDTPVRWKGRTDLTPLQGRPIALHFTARGAKLYAFQFAASGPPGA